MQAPVGPNYICLIQWAILQCVFVLLTKTVVVLAGPRYSSRIVETKTGAIRGVILELNSRHLEPVEVFKAVPYALPPVGNQRFEEPKSLPSWKGTKLADTFGPVCPQNFPDITNRTAALMYMPKGRYQYLKRLIPLLVNQSEDCLTLNIYVPGSGNRGLEAPYAVFFYVHGESFEFGSGNPYDGSVLASYGHIIVITVNFRLGILGFIKTRASSLPGSGGNLGLMDILAALHWTRDNIAAFGGDPSRVTIVGHDTGAALANLVLISKAGKALIHRAILLSGSALSPWSIIQDPDSIRVEVSQQMACHLDTNGNNRLNKDVTNDITNCLRSKPLEAIMGVRLPNVRTKLHAKEEKNDEQERLNINDAAFECNEDSAHDENSNVQNVGGSGEEDAEIPIEGEEDEDDDFEIEGIHLVNMSPFFEQLQRVSTHKDDCSFDELNIKKEIRIGLHSKIILECSNCHRRFRVYLTDDEKTTETVDINSSTVLGANMIGISYSQLEQFTSILNVPVMCNDKFKKVNDLIGKFWQETAEKCMREAAEEEALLAIQRGDVDPVDGVPFIAVVVDEWSKRAYNRNFTALSGVGAIVGALTGKVLWIGVRNRYCVTCVRAANQKITPKEHFCTRNFTGSSSEMEWQTILEGFKSSVELYNLRYLKLISDGDSSTYSKLLEHKPYQGRHIEKINCTNHLFRNFRKSIEAAVKGCPRGLNKHVVDNLERIRKDVCCAVEFRKNENTNESEKISLLKSDLDNMLHHVFGDHTNCPSYIKTFCKDDANYIPALKECNTFEKMYASMRQLIYCAKDLIQGETNNVAEHYNSIVAKFVGGKRVNFSLSNAYTYRANAAAVQFNTKAAISTLYTTKFQRNAPALARKVEVKRMQKTDRAKERRRIMKENKIFRTPFCRVKQSGPGYGENSQQADLSDENFENEKRIHFEKLKKHHVNRVSVEESTRLKQESSLWNEIVPKILLSKYYGSICKARALTKYVKELTQRKFAETKAMRHQKEAVAVARQQLGLEQSISIRDCGLYIDDEYMFLGTSPSGVVNDSDMVVEIQCPLAITNMDPNDPNVLGKLGFMATTKDKQVLGLNKYDDIYFDIQGQLHICNKKICLFAVWTSNRHKIFMPSWGPFLPLDDAPDPEFAMEHSGQGFITKELMIGMSTTESYNDFNAADIQYGLEEEQRNRLLRTYIRNAFSFHLNEIFSAVRNEYTDWDKPIQHPINIRDSTMEALSDGHTVAPLIKVGYLHARRGAKTYLFHFGYQTKDSEYPQRLGSVRGEDLPYIFGLPLVLGMPNFSQNFSRQDMGVAEAILNFVTNFCKTGDPNEAGHQQAMLHPDYGTARERTRYRGITWETYETTSQQYLSISLKPKMKSHYRGHKMAVWLNLIPQLHRPGDAEVSMRHHHFREREPHYYAGNVREESYTRPKQHYQNGVVNGAQESRQESFGPECTPDPTLGESLLDTEEPLILNEEEEELLQRLATRHYYSSYTAALGVTVGVGCLLLVLNMLIFAGIYYQRERSRRKTRTTRCNNGSTSGHGSPIDGDIPLTVRPASSPGKSKQEPPPSYTTLQRSPCTHRDKGTLNKNMCDAYKQQNIQSSQHHHTVTLCQNQHPKNASTKTHNPPQPPTRTSSNPPSSNVNQIEKQLEHHTQVHHQQGGICGNNGSGISEMGSGSGIGCSSGASSCVQNYNSNHSNTSTLKKRVQIQEITV